MTASRQNILASALAPALPRVIGSPAQPRPSGLEPDTLPQGPDTDGEASPGTAVEVCWHLYTDPQRPSEVVGAVIRLERSLTSTAPATYVPVHLLPGATGGWFKAPDGTPRSLPAGWVTQPPRPERLDLYRAAAIRRAKVEGWTGPVYLCAAESDADAVTEVASAGAPVAPAVLATAALRGAKGGWLAHWTELLAGLDVVLVLDRDPEGIQRGEMLATTLISRVRSLRTMQPIGIARTLREHLAGGHGLEQLREVDLGIPETGLDEHASGPNERPVFLVRNGELVERIIRQSRVRYRTVLGCVAWVDRVTSEDNGELDKRYQPPTRDVVIVVQRRDKTDPSVVVEERRVCIPIDKINKGTWLNELPYPDAIIARGRKASDRALEAIYQAIPSPTRRSAVYTCTGWRQTDLGWVYVHGGGGIGRSGSLPLDVDLNAILARTAMPEPVTDVHQLREAWVEGMLPLQRLPARIMAPLSGFVWRSVIGGPQQMVLNLHGPRGTMKSALSRLALQTFVPGLRFPHTKEMASGAAHMSTQKGIMRLLAAAKDLPLALDDFAPDRGGAQEAMTRLAEVARQMYNGSAQLKADRLPSEMVTELGPRGSLMTTAEVTAGGSAATRCFNVLIEPGAVEIEEIIAAESARACSARALLGASFLQWAAARYESLVAWIGELSSIFGAAWRQTLSDLPHDEGVLGRLAEAAAGYQVGITLQLTFLQTMGAISEAEAQASWDWATEGLRQSARDLDVDTTDPATKLIGWLAEALTIKAAHLTGSGGLPPQLPEQRDAPVRFGYTRQVRSGPGEGEPSLVSWTACGRLIGHLPASRPDRVYLLPDSAIEVARALCARGEDRWTETRAAFSAALDARGWLTVSTERGKRVRTPNREVNGRSTRVWDLPLALLDGTHHDQQLSGAADTPTPLDTRLRRPPQFGEIPMAAAPHLEPVAATGTVAATAPAMPPRLTGTAARQERPLRALPGGLEETAPTHSVPAHPTPAPAAAESAPSAPSATTTSPETGENMAPPTSPSSTAPSARSSRSAGSPARRATHDYSYPVAVLDIDAIYLPDGHRIEVEPDYLVDLGECAELAETFGIGHERDLGQLWISKRLSDRWGLVITDEDELPDPETRPKEFSAAVRELLTARGQQVIAGALAAGWSLGADAAPADAEDEHAEQPSGPEIRLRTRIHRDGRAFEVVLAHYAELWDARKTGPDHMDHPLPEPDEQPEAYCRELARRAGRLAEVLNMPWRPSAGQTGAAIMDRGRRSAKIKATEAGPIPELANAGAQNVLEKIWGWQRRFTPAHRPELDRARFLHVFDERASWLVRAGQLDVGTGRPLYLTQSEAEDLARMHVGVGQKLPFGVWRVTMPCWRHASLLPPHPMMPLRGLEEPDGDPLTQWVTTPSLRLLAHQEHLGLPVSVHEAWVWPESGRRLATWYKDVRAALVAARGGERAALEAVAAATDVSTRAAAEAELATWMAVAASVKDVYASYIGRMLSKLTLHSARPWHHQPVWRYAIVAEARRMAWEKIQRHSETGHYPVLAAGTDEFWYLSDSPDPASVAPEPDSGELGKLRVKGQPWELTDEHRDQLLRGASLQRLFTTGLEG